MDDTEATRGNDDSKNDDSSNDEGEHQFAASLVQAKRGKAMGGSGGDREVEVAVTRDGEPFQSFVILVARSLLKSAGGDTSDTSAQAVALAMQPTIRQLIADGTAPAPTEIELRLTDEAALAALLQRTAADPQPRFA